MGPCQNARTSGLSGTCTVWIEASTFSAWTFTLAGLGLAFLLPALEDGSRPFLSLALEFGRFGMLMHYFLLPAADRNCS